MDKRVTQKDVAKNAEVSQTTVSLVINNPDDDSISEDTKKKVLKAIQDLGYVPDQNAIRLRTNHNNAIAAVIPDIANPFYPSFLRGIQNVTRKHGYDLLIYDTNRKKELEKQALSSLAGRHVDGAIVMLFYHKVEEITPLKNYGVQLVSVEAEKPPDEFPIASIYIDNAKATRIAVKYFIKKGHKRIALLSGLVATPPQVNRVKGYSQELDNNQIAIIDGYIQESDFTDEGGYMGMLKLLEIDPTPTAVIAVDDLMAIGAMRAIKEKGLKIPDDVAILGFDDIPAASLVTPKLTTITSFAVNIGEQAALRCIQLITSPNELVKHSLELPVKLIIREST